MAYIPPEVEALFEKAFAENDARARQPAEERPCVPNPFAPTAENVRHERPQLVFANWSLVEPSRQSPGGFAQLCAHFRDLQDHLGVDVEGLSQWTLSEEDLGHLRFYLKHKSTTHIRRLVLAGINDSRIGLETTRQLEHARRRPKNFAEAREELVAAPRANACALDREEKQRDFFEHLHSGVVTPLMEEAMHEPDPQRRNRLLMAATLSQEFHLRAAAKSAELLASVAEYGVASLRSYQDEQSKEILTLADRIGKLTKEADR